jgi:hypothetical protein
MCAQNDEFELVPFSKLGDVHARRAHAMNKRDVGIVHLVEGPDRLEHKLGVCLVERPDLVLADECGRTVWNGRDAMIDRIGMLGSKPFIVRSNESQHALGVDAAVSGHQYLHCVSPAQIWPRPE